MFKVKLISIFTLFSHCIVKHNEKPTYYVIHRIRTTSSECFSHRYKGQYSEERSTQRQRELLYRPQEHKKYPRSVFENIPKSQKYRTLRSGGEGTFHFGRHGTSRRLTRGRNSGIVWSLPAERGRDGTS